MRAPNARAISQVRSVEPESTRITSSATPWSEASARGKSNSSLYAIKIAVTAGIGNPKLYGSTKCTGGGCNYALAAPRDPVVFPPVCRADLNGAMDEHEPSRSKTSTCPQHRHSTKENPETAKC